MTNGPVVDTAVKPASRRAAKGARGCPTRPLGCGYELRRRRCAAQGRGGAAHRSDEPGKPARRPALSPSRAADFKQCPLLYRFRAIDRLPEPPSTAQVRGSAVPAALGQLYGLPAAQRVPETAGALVAPAWEQVLAAEPDLVAELDAAQQLQLLDDA